MRLNSYKSSWAKFLIDCGLTYRGCVLSFIFFSIFILLIILSIVNDYVINNYILNGINLVGYISMLIPLLFLTSFDLLLYVIIFDRELKKYLLEEEKKRNELNYSPSKIGKIKKKLHFILVNWLFFIVSCIIIIETGLVDNKNIIKYFFIYLAIWVVLMFIIFLFLFKKNNRQD
jgi:hypothetical protein